jgi:hypothetical protein
MQELRFVEVPLFASSNVRFVLTNIIQPMHNITQFAFTPIADVSVLVCVPAALAGISYCLYLSYKYFQTIKPTLPQRAGQL